MSSLKPATMGHQFELMLNVPVIFFFSKPRVLSLFSPTRLINSIIKTIYETGINMVRVSMVSLGLKLALIKHLTDLSYGIPHQMSQCMRFPTMWFVRPAKPQISLRIRAV